MHTPVPISEPPNPHPQGERVTGILRGTIAPDSPDTKVLEIVGGEIDPSLPVLWRAESGVEVVQLWPGTNR